MTNEMVPQSADIAEILRGPNGDFLRKAASEMLREIIESEVPDLWLDAI